jgi:23S rRNA (adenine2030-N6)-methyltransferase
MTACEVEASARKALIDALRRDAQARVVDLDGWTALPAFVPPNERRGLVLIDPPFEDPQEFSDLATGLAAGHPRFGTGVFAAWYPIKHRAPVRQFRTKLQDSGIRDIVAAELCLREPVDASRLNGCGVLVINPPYRFEQEVQPILAALLDRLGSREAGEAVSIDRLADE